MSEAKGIIGWAARGWLASAVIGAGAAFLLQRPFPATIVTANDVAVGLLLLPWFLEAALHSAPRRSASEAMTAYLRVGADQATIEEERKRAVADMWASARPIGWPWSPWGSWPSL